MAKKVLTPTPKFKPGDPDGDIILFIEYFIADDGINDVIVLNSVLCEVPEYYMEKV